MDKGYYDAKKAATLAEEASQSTIKMDKGYYTVCVVQSQTEPMASQSTIKMDKGYYEKTLQ